MVVYPLEREIIVRRAEGIQGELVELIKLGQEPLQLFTQGVGFKLAQYHLHRALEGVFNIASHILSRLPGVAPTTYKEIARNLGSLGIADRDFAEKKLVSMAGYRNRLVHFYAEITPEEMHGILKENLKDIEEFLRSIQNLLQNPEKFGLTII